MNCLHEEQLSLVLQGRVPASDDAAWTQHIDACPHCQVRLEQLAGGTDWLPQWGVEERASLAETGPDHHRAATLLEDHENDEGNLAAWHAPEGSDDSLAGILTASDRPEFKGRFGPFYVIDIIGQGGMGVVFKAHEPTLARTVAVKLLAPQLAASETARRRFLREARAAARVVDDHVVAIHAVDQVRGLPYLVMQFIEGESLEARLRRRGTLGVSEVVQLARQTARALQTAHQAGLVHRDVKPANILLEASTGRCKITDFGLARAAEDDALTRTGFIAGTPQYMAPEQARGDSVDHRADLYSLGAVLFFALTAQPPFFGETPLSVINKVIQDEAPAIRSLNAAVPDWLEAIVRRLMAKEPDDRFQSADELLKALSAYQPKATTPDRESGAKHAASSFAEAGGRRWTGNPGLLAAVGIALAAVALLALMVWRNPPQEANAQSNAGRHHASHPSGNSPPRSTSGCCIHQPDETTIVEDNFGEALNVARDGSTIELRGPGPFRVNEPLDTSGKRLVIRAADNSAPVIIFTQGPRSAGLPGLTVSGPLVLEGIEFRFENGSLQATGPGSLITAVRQPLYVTNCRFHVTGASHARLSCISLDRSTGVIQNSLLTCDSKGSALVLGSAEDSPVRVENCIFLAQHAVTLHRPLADLQRNAQAVALFSNTVVAHCGVHLLNRAGVPYRPGPDVKLQVRDNLFDVGYLCAVTLAAASDPASAELAALDQLSQTVKWTGGGNLYSVGHTYCGFSTGSRPHVPARSGPRSLISWQDFSYEEDDSSFEAKVVFGSSLTGGRPRPDVRITPNDYRFPLDPSDGQTKATDHVGANTELVGPGTAYRTWQGSAAANQWPSHWQDAFH